MKAGDTLLECNRPWLSQNTSVNTSFPICWVNYRILLQILFGSSFIILSDENAKVLQLTTSGMTAVFKKENLEVFRP